MDCPQSAYVLSPMMNACPTRPVSAIASLLLVAALGACATQPNTNVGYLGDYSTLTPVDGTVRAQIAQRLDTGVASRADTIVLRPSRVSAQADVDAGIEATDFALVTAEMDRQLCHALARSFNISSGASPGALEVEAVITRLQRTSAGASVASAAISRVIPGPGSVRLPVGRGGLSVEASARTGDGQEAAAMVWSRGAGVVMDRGSLSEVGDAHRFASAFAGDFADLLDQERPQMQRTGADDPCAAYGPRVDVARRALGIGLGLHVTGGAQLPAGSAATGEAAAQQ
jgi:hypothetical protein